MVMKPQFTAGSSLVDITSSWQIQMDADEVTSFFVRCQDNGSRFCSFKTIVQYQQQKISDGLPNNTAAAFRTNFRPTPTWSSLLQLWSMQLHLTPTL